MSDFLEITNFFCSHTCPDKRRAFLRDLLGQSATENGELFGQVVVSARARCRFGTLTVESLVQEMLCRLLEQINNNHLDNINPDGNVERYLSVVIRRISHRAYWELLRSEESRHHSRHEMPSDVSFERDDQIQPYVNLFRYLNELPGDSRKIIRLKLFCGWTIRKIAVQMQLPKSTVNRKYQQGLRTLRMRLNRS